MPRLRWESKADRGPANAINKGLAKARGDLIGWLNSDDIYAPGAIAYATREFADKPELVMLYGEGEFVDETGRCLGRYPTKPPSVGIEAFQSGCFICQPTVFLRRDVFEELGGLDENLSTSFDFDLWLRLFRQFPGRIGYTDRVQAFSRVHGRTITSRQRSVVACEAVELLSKHLGFAEPHWILTYIDEAAHGYPTYERSINFRDQVSGMLSQLESCFRGDDFARLRAIIDLDRRLDTPPGVHVNMYPDGWAGRELLIKIRSLRGGSFSLILQCEKHGLMAAPLGITVCTSAGMDTSTTIRSNKRFELAIPFRGMTPNQRAAAAVRTQSVFVPKLVERGSTDTRELAFRVLRITFAGG